VSGEDKARRRERGCLLLASVPVAILAIGLWNVRRIGDERRRGLEARGWSWRPGGDVVVRGALDGVAFETRVWRDEDPEWALELHEVRMASAGARTWLGGSGPQGQALPGASRGAEAVSGQDTSGLEPKDCSPNVKTFSQPGAACPDGLVAAFVQARGGGAHAPLTVERGEGRLRVFFRWDEHADAAWLAGDVEAAVRLRRASERP
jgi:hypothetical protein